MLVLERRLRASRPAASRWATVVVRMLNGRVMGRLAAGAAGTARVVWAVCVEEVGSVIRQGYGQTGRYGTIAA
jgi:hypothetical protein